MNNKGFAITGILYGLMLIFILALTSFLSILVGKNRRIDSLMDNIYDNQDYYFYGDIKLSSSDYYFETENKGFYFFAYCNSDTDCNKDNYCIAFLPSDTLVITGKYIDGANDNDFYYKYGGGNKIDEYKKLNCINNKVLPLFESWNSNNGEI